jgi:hypothetical protein
MIIFRKYDSGAVGSFTHIVALQGTDYSCELEVFADGYSMKCVSSRCSVKTNCLTRYDRLVNPYVQPVLYVRKPGDDYEQTYRFPDDDPFFSEVSITYGLLYQEKKQIDIEPD